MHLWFARRPLTASRATVYAALVNDTNDHRRTLEKISVFSHPYADTKRRDGSGSYVKAVIKAKADVLESHKGVPPVVLDPFGGGGAIPLECMRLGCKTHSNDYNPVAWIIQRCTLEWPQKYGVPGSGAGPKDSRLVKDICKWVEWLDGEVKNELAGCHTGTEYIWARTIPCQNPKCGVDIPLLKSFEIDRKGGVFACPQKSVDGITFNVVGGKNDEYGELPPGHDPKARTVRNMVVMCPACCTVLKADVANKLLFQSDKDRMVAVVERPTKGKKRFREVTPKDVEAYGACAQLLESERAKFKGMYGIDPVPDEPMGTPDGREYEAGGWYWVFNMVTPAGQTRWSHLCNDRQLLFMAVMSRKIREAHEKMLGDGVERGYADCLATYLAVIQDRLAARGQTKTSIWTSRDCRTISGLSGSSIRKIVSYAEVSPFDRAGIRQKAKDMTDAVLAAASVGGNPATITNMSATSLAVYGDNHFDAVFTDPPYYDFVPYADFADFFYVWLKRSIGHIFPDSFRTTLCPKARELITNVNSVRGSHSSPTRKNELRLKTKEFYENGMAEALLEMHRVLKQDGILTLVYSHTSLDSWETLIKAIRRSGFTITAAWPIATETKARMTAQAQNRQARQFDQNKADSGAAAIQSSIYMVGRKHAKHKSGIYSTVSREMFGALDLKLGEFDGTLGRTDYMIAAIGYALEWCTKYERLMRVSGEEVTVCDMLEDIRKFVMKRILKNILGSEAKAEGMLRPFIMYRWTYGTKWAPYDAARKMFAGCGMDIRDGGGFVEVRGDRIRFREPSDFGSVDDVPDSGELGLLYKAILLRQADRADDCYKMLAEEGLDTPAFWDRMGSIARGLGENGGELLKLVEGARIRTSGPVQARLAAE